MLAGNKNRPETDCAAHPKDAKSSLSDFFTSTMQNLAGSSVASSLWQIHCRKVLMQVEAYPGGIDGFTIKLYDSLFGRKLRFVNPVWFVADNGVLFIRDRKNKHDFWMEDNGRWEGQPRS